MNKKKLKALKILSGNRITLPKEFLDNNNLSEGDHVTFKIMERNRIIIVPVEFSERG